MANSDYKAFRKWFDDKIVNVKSNKQGIPDSVRIDMLKAWNAGFKEAQRQHQSKAHED